MKITTSVWRYSHLALAISSSIFILIAAVTGIILSFEPISNQLKPYAVTTNNVTISQTITSLKKEHKEVITLEVDEHNFVTAAVITKNGKNKTFYINPSTGKKISSVVSKASIFKWTTNLHRSLFLKSTGRFLVGFFSFLLFLITLTGSILIIKRQGGITRFFSKIIKDDFNQYYHIILGRFTLIPILIITITAVYLSLEKFSLLPKTNIKHTFDFSEISSNKKIAIDKFPIFNNTSLSEVKSIEFPFSDDPEDYFLLKLKNKELIIHQYSGEIISEKKLPLTKILSNWSLFLHTGRGTIIWSIILLLSCIAILFFIYSGFAMTIAKKRKSKLPKNIFKKENAEIIILVGSESGNTFNMAISLFKALTVNKKSVFIDHLNNYSTYKKATQLIILTATYGEGDPPANATNFLKLTAKIKQPNPIKYAVIGFGSLAYPNYCEFAITIDEQLKKKNNFSPILPIFKINNQNFSDFKNWANQWNKITEIKLALKQKLIKPKKQQSFTVKSITNLNIDNSFLIRLQPSKKLHFSSGDLLAITPKKDNLKRLYSVGKINDDILLSIKKHEFGVCSNLLFNLKIANTLLANIEKNKAFHLPKKSKSTILIANGTGIAPFLGMLQNTTKTHLFWGGRTKESLKMYAPFLTNLNKENIHIAYSQEQNKEYVQDLILKQQTLIASTLKNNGTIMICGSIAMMNGVVAVLEAISLKQLNTPLSKFKNNKQIKTDCY